MDKVPTNPEDEAVNFKMIDTRDVSQVAHLEAAASLDQPPINADGKREGIEQEIDTLLDSAQLSPEQNQWINRLHKEFTQSQDASEGARFRADLHRFLSEYQKSQETSGSEQLSDSNMQALVSRALPAAQGKLRQLGAGGSRVGYLIESSGCVVRVDKSTFGASVDRLQRRRDYDYAKLIQNRFLVGDVRDFSELPMDIQEVVVPLNQAMKEAAAKNDGELVELLNKAKASNSLVSEHVMEAKDTNLGLVKRQGLNGRADLYVIAFDLGAMYQFVDAHGQQYLQKICREAQPISIPFVRAAQSIESIAALPEEGAVDRFLQNQKEGARASQ